MHLNGLNVTASGTASVAEASGGATLWAVNVNTSAAGSLVKIYNGTTSTGASIATVDGTSKGSLWYGIRCPNGIAYSITGGAPDVTIVWQ